MKISRNLVASIGLGLALAVASPATAAFKQSAVAPDFKLGAALAGKSFDFSLKDARRKGPVVLYFFPAAFTTGCTVDAHMFADATDDFKKRGATVVGVTAGKVEKATAFSRSECRDQFAMAADPGAKIAAQHEAVMSLPTATLSERSSYVIASEAKILLIYTDMNLMYQVVDSGVPMSWEHVRNRMEVRGEA